MPCGWRVALSRHRASSPLSLPRERFQGASSSLLWSLGSVEVRARDLSFAPPALPAVCGLSGGRWEVWGAWGVLLPRTVFSPEPVCAPTDPKGLRTYESSLCPVGPSSGLRAPWLPPAKCPCVKLTAVTAGLAGRFGQAAPSPMGCLPGTVAPSTGPLWLPPLELGEATRSVSPSLLRGLRYSGALCMGSLSPQSD